MSTDAYHWQYHYQAPEDAEQITQDRWGRTTTIRPTRAEVSVYPEARVPHHIFVSGPRILKSGQEGRSRGLVGYDRDEDNEGTDRHIDAAPQWVRDLLDGTP